MKKYFLLTAISLFSLGALASCDKNRDNDHYQDNDTYSVAYDFTESFVKNKDGNYVISKAFKNSVPSSDVILVYRRSGTDGANAIWQQIPRTLYLTNGNELDYDFDFTRSDVLIKAGGNYDISTTPQYLTNQTFRVVFVPAAAGKNASVDYSNYQSVENYYKFKINKL